MDVEASNWTWDEQAGQFFWHRFYASQPDLNYDNPAVQEEILNIARYWLELGIDGFRADAVPYLFEREGTNCENLPETHAYLKSLRAAIDQEFPGRILLCEANQHPDDVREYFGNGDEFQMGFNFPIMPRLFMVLKKGRIRRPARHPRPHTVHPAGVPMVYIPPQSRRADAGNGNAGRTAVDVGSVRAGCTHAPEPWHPPPACPAAG